MNKYDVTNRLVEGIPMKKTPLWLFLLEHHRVMISCLKADDEHISHTWLHRERKFIHSKFSFMSALDSTLSQLLTSVS